MWCPLFSSRGCFCQSPDKIEVPILYIQILVDGKGVAGTYIRRYVRFSGLGCPLGFGWLEVRSAIPLVGGLDTTLGSILAFLNYTSGVKESCGFVGTELRAGLEATTEILRVRSMTTWRCQ